MHGCHGNGGHLEKKHLSAKSKISIIQTHNDSIITVYLTRTNVEACKVVCFH